MAGYRPPYTLQEENAILRFIVDTQSYYRVKGKKMWQELEEIGTVDRTWQSLKEHFRKAIVPNILVDVRYEISAEERRKIGIGFGLNAATTSRKGRPKQEKERKEYDLENMSSSEEEKLYEAQTIRKNVAGRSGCGERVSKKKHVTTVESSDSEND